MRKPKASTSHQSQAFSSRTRSVLRFTISVHLARERPKPARAPYRAAIVWQKHMRSMKPTYKEQVEEAELRAVLFDHWLLINFLMKRLTQLKRKAVRNAVKKTKSLPRRAISSSPSQSSRLDINNNPPKKRTKQQHLVEVSQMSPNDFFDSRGISPGSPARRRLLSLIFHIASKQFLFQLFRLVKMTD